MTHTNIKAVFFDFMGTCLDWHSGTIKALPQTISESERIEVTLEKTLDALLEKRPVHKRLFDEKTKERCIAAWHSMPAWPDVARAIGQLKSAGYEVFVHANGTTRLQLDLCKSSGLSFNMLFSSQLLGVYKPAPESYREVLRLVNVKPGETVLVAAHAYDTRGAKEAGMKTVYIQRWTDDLNEDMEVVKGENDFFLEDMTNLAAVIKQL
ncbi:HAD-like domain-containing protein [Lipomyces orientalis]|uniref:HAD-like domain-containing protein n=1 Tax=Lipomyces orientalis TaxID=1233043 RepID=A0ACC3TLH0_9ASCO